MFQFNPINVAAKIEFHEKKQAARLARKTKKRRQRRCFWTPPRGHKYVRRVSGLLFHWGCVGCGKSVND